MNTPTQDKTAQLLAEIENFAALDSHTPNELSSSDLRALARSAMDIDLTEAAPARPPAPSLVAAEQKQAQTTVTSTQTAPPSMPESLTQTGLLAKLKRQAEEKLAAQTQSVAIEAARLRQIDEGLRGAYRYLKELVEQLNVIKPDYPGDYPLGTLLRFEKPSWQESQADFRRKIGPTEDLPYINVSLRYVLRCKAPIVLDKVDHLVETTRKALHDYGLTFKLDEKRNFKGFVERGIFLIQPEIKAGLLFEADYDNGKLQLRTRNVQRFGSATYDVPPSAINEQTLEEIALLVLGQSNQFIQRFKRIA